MPIILAPQLIGARGVQPLANAFSLSLAVASVQTGTAANFLGTGTGASTISAWIKGSTLDSIVRGIVTLGTTGLATQSGNLTFVRAGTAQVFTANSIISTGTWYHVAATTAGGGITDANVDIYLNGVSQSLTQSASGNEEYSGDVIVGGFTTSSQIWDGLLDEIAVWNAQLSAAEILEIYNAADTANDKMPDLTKDFGDYANAANLQAFWRMEEGSGSSVADTSGNGNTLTLNNSPTFSSDVA